MTIKLTLLFSIFFSTTVLAYSVPIETTTDTIKKDTVAADFPGGMHLFYDYLRKNVKYPISSRLKGVQGKVHLKFVIDTMGRTTGVKVVKGLDKFTNLEALRVIRQSPNWIPGTINGKKTRFDFNIPISFTDTSSFAGADVMVNGKLLKNNKKLKNFPLDSMHFFIISKDLTQAIFGSEFKNKMLIFNEKNLNLNGYDQVHFKNTFDKLKHIDTSKVQLNVWNRELPLHEWQKYLNKDSILSICIYPPDAAKTYNSKKIGMIVLMNKAGVDNQNKMRRDLINQILAYRSGRGKLPKENLLIDNYHFYPFLVYSSIDTAVIKSVSVLDSTQSVRLYGDAYKSGIIYIYTKNYNVYKPLNDRNKLLKMIDEYKRHHQVAVDDHIFLNNQPIGFKELVDLPPSAIQYVNMVSKEEIKSFLGIVDSKNCIFIDTTPDYRNKAKIEVKVLPPPEMIK